MKQGTVSISQGYKSEQKYSSFSRVGKGKGVVTGPVKEKDKERKEREHAYLYVLKVRTSVRTVSHNPLGFAFTGSLDAKLSPR